MDVMLKIVQTINSYLTDYVLIFLLIGAGLYFTVRTKFVQVRCFGEGMRMVFGKLSLKGGKQKSGLSSFQALSTAIAAQVGTGNIVGACGAILLGGPGAIFWMWVIAFLGMATIYAEAVLAQKTRVIDADGNVLGGPVYYIKAAFQNKFGKFLSVFFAVAAILALGFMGSMVQSNSIANTAGAAMGLDSALYWIIGLAVALIAGAIFLGGVDRLASVTEKLVPCMALLYIAGSLVIILARIAYLPEAFGMIFSYAFNANALIGGGIGYALKCAISQGAKRGLFSNEAGMGSTPHAHAQANVKTPHEQGVTAMIGVFIDTFIVLTMTALVVISTLYAGGGALGNALSYNRVDGGLITAGLKNEALGRVGEITRVNPKVVNTLLDQGFVPVVSPISLGEDGSTLNVNADDAARAVAEALGADHLVFLTDTAGILIDSHNSKTAVDRMDVKRAQELIDAGLIAGGMVPKVKGCLHAIENGVGEVSILDGRGEHSLLLRMLGQRVDGTIITP